MKPVLVARVAALVAVAGFAFACTDRSNVAGPPVVERGPTVSSLNDLIVTCSANVTARTVKCGDSDNGFKNDLIIGGQGTYVKLTSSNVSVVADTIGFDVSVQNLIGQPIGTTDSVNTPAVSGVRVFFVQGPTSVGAGTITVANADGISVFTGANQSYFRYFNVLYQGETSGTKRWKLQFSPAVTNFTFQVGVSAPVEFQHGYVDGLARVLTLKTTELFNLPSVVRNALGTVQPNQIVTYTTGNAGIALTADSTVTGVTNGFTVLRASNGSRPGVSDIYAHVCPALTMTVGSSHVDSITASDCFTAFHPDELYLPGTVFHGDLYRVTLTAGQMVDISVDTGNGLDTRLVLMDRLGYFMAENDDDAVGSLAPGSRIQFTAPSSGVYVIQVTTYAAVDTGTYTLTLANQP